MEPWRWRGRTRIGKWSMRFGPHGLLQARAIASHVRCRCLLCRLHCDGTGALHLNNGLGTPNKGSRRCFYWIFFFFLGQSVGLFGPHLFEKPQIWVSRKMEPTHWASPSPRGTGPATRNQPSYANPPAAFVSAATAAGGRGKGRGGAATTTAMADKKRLRHREYVKRSYNKKIVRNACVDHMDNAMRMHSGR